MKRFLLVLVLSSGILTSCFRAAGPLIGTYNLSGKGQKEGRACRMFIFGIPAGDSSLQKAMDDGGIKEVTAVDHSFHFMLFAARSCTIVHGN